jgi:hypothetical protein
MATQYEYQFEEELSPLHEGEADQFFGRIIKKVTPLLKRIAPMAARIVAGAVPGVGVVAGPLAGRLVSVLTKEQQQQLESLLQESVSLPPSMENTASWETAAYEEELGIPYSQEYQQEVPSYESGQWAGYESAVASYGPSVPNYGSGEQAPAFQWESNYENLTEAPADGETASAWETSARADQEAQLMEQIAQEATDTESASEAEALSGTLVPVAMRNMRRMREQPRQPAIPALARASGRYTTVVRQHPATRLLLRALPTILRRTRVILEKQEASGVEITPRMAVKIMADQTWRVLSNPTICIRVLNRSARIAPALS